MPKCHKGAVYDRIRPSKSEERVELKRRLYRLACSRHGSSGCHDHLSLSGPTQDYAAAGRAYDEPGQVRNNSQEQGVPHLAKRIHNHDRVSDVVWAATREEVLTKCLFSPLLGEHIYSQ
jgi:hypothetical protein